jgi:membrane associated rhomboid family serine protease
MFQLTPAVRALLIINFSLLILDQLAGRYLSQLLGLHDWYHQEFLPYQLVSYAYFHADFRHFFSNGIALFFFGSRLEMVWGTKRFLTYYFITAFGAGLIFFGVNTYSGHQVRQDAEIVMNEVSPEGLLRFMRKHDRMALEMNKEFLADFQDKPEHQPYINEAKVYLSKAKENLSGFLLIGASGAIMALVFAMGYLFPNTEVMLFLIPFPIKMKYIAAVYILIDVYSEFKRMPGDNVAHLAHLAGVAVGFLVLLYWQKNRQRFY